MARRLGRGRLSTLDLLPDEAEADLVWLNTELREGRQTQVALLDEFNERLARLGIAPISKGAFSRYSVRKATQFRQLDETRRIAADLTDALGVDSADQMTIAVAEMLKMSAFKLAESGGLNPMDVMSLARAAKDVTTAQKTSADYRRGIEREIAQKVAEAAKDVAEIGKSLGVSEEAMRKINMRLAGVA